VVRPLLCFFTAISVWSPLTSAQSGSRAADEAYIRQSESAWAESAASGDVSALRQILADEFVGLGVDGTQYTKADALRVNRDSPSKFASNHLNSVAITFFGDTAIARGNESWVRKDGGKGTFFWTDTWIKRKGKWQIVAAEDLIAAPDPFK